MSLSPVVDTRSSSVASVDQLPVFPLDHAVLFPGVVLPLRVAEPSESELIADSVACHGLVVVTMIRPGAAADNPPALCEVGCLGRIIVAQVLSSGAYDVQIEGIERVVLGEEVASARGYRCFRARPCVEPTAGEQADARRQWRQLHHCVHSLDRLARGHDDDLVEILHSTQDPLELSDLLAAVLVRDPAVQQELLARMSLPARLDLLVDCLMETMAELGSPAQRPNRH